MTVLEIFLPIVLLALAFLLKLLIDRTATIPIFIQSVFELPVDIVFLATSFVIAFTIITPENNKIGLVYFLIYIVCAVIVVFFWRRSTRFFEQNKYVLSGLLASLNYGFCTTAIVIAIRLLIGAKP